MSLLLPSGELGVGSMLTRQIALGTMPLPLAVTAVHTWLPCNRGMFTGRQAPVLQLQMSAAELALSKASVVDCCHSMYR